MAILVVLGLIAAFVISIWLAEDDESARPESGVTVEDVADEDAFDDDGFAEGLVGREVTVSGEVSQVLEPSVLLIGGDDFGGDGLLVINAGQTDVEEGDVIRVTGTVRHYEAASFNTLYGGLGYDDPRWGAWRDENVLAASEVETLDADD